MSMLNISLWYGHQYMNILLRRTTIILYTCITIALTLLLSLFVSSSTPDIPVHWTLCSIYTLFTPDTTISCASTTVTQILLHWILLLHAHILPIHGYTISLDTVISYICIIATWILCTQLYHVHTSLLHRFTSIHALIISAFLLHGSLFILHG